MVRNKTGESKLRPRARIIRTIGEELISNDVVAVIELIKNSYDADAEEVDVTLDGPVFKKQSASKKQDQVVIPKNKGVITIKDNGHGMTLDVIQTGWMEPATIIKKIKSKSPEKERRLLGEKGVGRFAAARLSSKLELITKASGENRINASFNWSDFSDDSKYLDEINCYWEEVANSKKSRNGTILKLLELNSDWDNNKVNELKTALSRLMNPVNLVPDFKIRLNIPKEFNIKGGNITPPASLGKPDYKIEGSVDNRGFGEIKYSSRNGAEEINKKLELKSKSNPLCGPFGFEFRVWDREKESLERLAKEVKSTLRDVKRDLNEAYGINIYRDDFRVLPYGESKNDWLRLDLRRVQNPTMRISNNQAVGIILISLDSNPALKDQSNREGIVDSQAFSDLQELVILIFAELERRRYNERPRQESNPEDKNLYSAINIESVEKLIGNKIPNDKEVKKIIVETKANIKKGLNKIQEVLARYRRLSTLGQLVDIVLHDGNSVLLNIDSEALLLEKEFKKKTVSEDKILKHLAFIKSERKTLAELFTRLEPFSGRKQRKPEDLVIENVVRDIFLLHSTDINDLNINVSLPQTESRIVFCESDLKMTIVNLLQNSMYWLERKKKKNREIAVDVYCDNDNCIILFSDNGPGVKDDDVTSIFDPYFTTKPDGIGLGLNIAGELIAESNGTLELISGGPLDGATFKITLKKG